MPADRLSDDVIRIRVDTAQAVRDFLAVLSAQAAEGETRAPANPANRAVFRELAPYRLVEYEYVDEAIGAIEGVFLGFPDGSIYAVADDIPEECIDALVAGDPTALPPVYVHVVLSKPQPAERIDHFLGALACHVGKPVVAVYRDDAAVMSAHAYNCGREFGAEIEGAVTKSALEADMHLSKARVLERFAARSQGADGRAYAQLTLAFTPHLLEFRSAAERDDFIAWSRTLCDWVYARWCSWEDLGFSEVLRPATVAPAGAGAVPLLPPGDAWQAFGGKDCATARDFAESDASSSEDALERSLDIARRYWTYVTETLAQAGRGRGSDAVQAFGDPGQP